MRQPPHRALWSRLSSGSGTVIVVIVLAMTSLVGSAALTLDVGRYMEMRRQLQNAVDAAAHAGALQLPDTDAAEDAANEYWDLNKPNIGEGAITISYPETGRIRIEADAETDVLLMDIFGVDKVGVDAYATAGIDKKDVILALDYTGSMSAGELNDLLEAAEHFVELLDDGSGSVGDGDFAPMRVGLVTFPEWDPDTNDAVSGAGVVVPLGFNESDMFDGIDKDDLWNDGGPGGYGTRIGDAINVASAELGEPAPTKIIVLMSDGDNTKGANPITAANNFATGGNKLIYTVGMGVSGSTRQKLIDIADIGGGFYLDAPTSAELEAAFEEVAKAIRVQILE